MMVERSDHLQPLEAARKAALESWLIRPSFFDKHYEAFRLCYAPARAALQDLESPRREIVKAFDVDRRHPMAQVADLEQRSNSEDIYMVRDVLQESLRLLASPRQILGVSKGTAMNAAVISRLKFQCQSRLRCIICTCLQKLRISGQPDNILREAIALVRCSISKFLEKAGDDSCLSDASSSSQWLRLARLTSMIEADIVQRRPAQFGQNTKALVSEAIRQLGGVATTKQILDFINDNSELLTKMQGAKLNWQKRSFDSRHVWRRTVTNAIGTYFERVGLKVAGQASQWRVPAENICEGSVFHRRQKVQRQALSTSQQIESDDDKCLLELCRASPALETNL